MGSYVQSTYNQSKHQFVTTADLGANVAIVVTDGETAIFIGSALSAVRQHADTVRSLENCAHVLQDLSVPSASTGIITLAHTPIGLAKTNIVVLNTIGLVIPETDVAVIYTNAWRNVPASSSLLINAVKRLIEWWLETQAKAA